MAVLQGGLSLPRVKPVATQPLYNPLGANVQPITAANANNWNQQINQLSKNYQSIYQGDETLQGQIRALQAQLQGQWSGAGGDLGRIQQLALQLGAVPGGLERFKTPTINGQPFGMSISDALNDPSFMANARNNPYSTMAGIANQLRGANFAGFHGLGGRGMNRSGAVNALGQANQFQAGKARFDATNQFLGALNDIYTGSLGRLDQAAQTQAGFYNDAFGRASELIKAGIYGTPTQAKSAPSASGGGSRTTSSTTGRIGAAPKLAGIPGVSGNLSPNTGMQVYKPFQDSLIGPHGRAPLGASSGMYRLGSGFKITPNRGRALR